MVALSTPNFQRVKIRHIEVFRAVVLSGSIRSAAEQLHVSPPAVSASLKQLETIVGFELFLRTANGLVATSEGIAFNKRVAALYENLDEISAFALQLRNGVDASLRIACSPNLALEIVPRVVARLLKDFPSSSFNIEVMPTKELTNSIAAQRVDVGVGINLPNGPFGKPFAVGRCAVVAAVPTDWPEAREHHLTPSVLAKRPWIRFHPETTQGAATHEWLSRESVHSNSVASVRVARVACSLVEQGIGFALLDEFTASKAAKDRVVCLPITPSITYSVDCLTASAPTSTRLSDAFVRELQRAFPIKAALGI
jgi:DNA-binding transcriptional LysR family regulator